MGVDDNGERLSMPGTYDGWTVSMWLKWDTNGYNWDIPFILRHPTSAENTYHKITFQNYGGNKTFYGGYVLGGVGWINYSKIPNNTKNLIGEWIHIVFTVSGENGEEI